MRITLVVLAFTAALGLPVVLGHQAAAVPAATYVAGGFSIDGEIDWP